jgi:hypothetical protein
MMRLYLLGTVLLVLAVGVTSFWLLERTTGRQIDALVVNQMQEFRVRFLERLSASAQAEGAEGPAEAASASPTEPGQLEEIALQILERQRVPSAWRVWSVTDSAILVEVGETDLLGSSVPAMTPRGRMHVAEGNRRWRTEDLSLDLVAGVVVDASTLLEDLRRYQLLAGALMALAAAVSLGLGAYMVQGMTRMLRRVSASARAVQEPTREVVELDLPDAPDEIRDVVDALRGLFDRVRAEADRSPCSTPAWPTSCAHRSRTWSARPRWPCSPRARAPSTARCSSPTWTSCATWATRSTTW